jgi:Domain of unknown function (DUF4189)
VGEVMKQFCLFFIVPFAAAILWSNHSSAEGALAIGLPADVSKAGFAYGYTNNQASSEKAGEVALSICRKPSPSKSETARTLCKVIKTYRNQCVAVAEDPQAGTPGVGWAVADDLHTAEAQALSKCEATAGRARRAACVIDHSNCDGSAK